MSLIAKINTNARLLEIILNRHYTNVVFIDYSAQYYLTVAETAVPDKRAGKFVQIRNDATEYLVFSPKEFTLYHADLVERFCSDKGLKGSYNKEGKRFDIHDLVWVIVGGGRFEIDSEKRYLCLYDNSMAYGRFDPMGLKEKILSIDALSGHDVKIE